MIFFTQVEHGFSFKSKLLSSVFRETAVSENKICHCQPNFRSRIQWSGNIYGNGYGLEMDGNGTHFVKMLCIGFDLG